jgi:hypothetical protein
LSAVPPLLRWSGITEAEKPSGGTLQEFIDEQRTTGASDDAASTSSPEPLVLDDVKSAARTIHAHLGKRAKSPESAWRQSLQPAADTLPGHQVEYAASAKEMADQLASGTGKPVSETRVAQLFDWQKTDSKPTFRPERRDRPRATPGSG